MEWQSSIKVLWSSCIGTKISITSVINIHEYSSILIHFLPTGTICGVVLVYRGAFCSKRVELPKIVNGVQILFSTNCMM